MAAEAVWDIATRSCLRSHTKTHSDVYTYTTLTVWIIGSLVENLSTRDKCSAPKVSLLRRFDCMRTVNDQRENL